MNTPIKKPKIVGILNITDDSFYDGGKYIDTESAIKHAISMLEDGADVIDIGAESTRPGADPVDEDTEIARIIPVIVALKKRAPDCTVSVDTYKPQTAQKVLIAGADIINDIYALTYTDTKVGERQQLKHQIQHFLDFPQAKIVLMHCKGTPQDMQDNPQYENVVLEIIEFFKQRIDYCVENGIAKDRIIIDPGIGFGKTALHNITILQNLDKFTMLNLPTMIGASRKSFINHISPSKPDERIGATLATTAMAYLKNIDYIRVHDVREHRQMIDTLFAMGI